jgi:hypothetical protein
VAHLLERRRRAVPNPRDHFPAGFERFFAELVDLGGVAHAKPEELGALCQRYALEMNPASLPDLIERFGVRFPAEPLG